MIPRRGREDREEARLRESYDLVWREREELTAEVAGLREQLEAERATHATLERRLRNTLVFAENAAGKLKETTRHDAETALRKARARAEQIVAAAEKRRDALTLEAVSLERRLAERERAARQAADEQDAKARRLAELTLRKAREHADEIVRAAEARRRELEAEVDRARAGYRDFLTALERLAAEAAKTRTADLGAEESPPEAPVPPSLPLAAGPATAQRPRN